MKFCFIFRKLCSVQRNYIFPEVGERGCEIKWGGGGVFINGNGKEKNLKIGVLTLPFLPPL